MVTGFGHVGGLPPAVLKPVPAAIPCCCVPLVVIAPTCVSMFWLALKMPALNRKTDFWLFATSQAKPKRGCHMSSAFGIFPLDGNFGSLRFEAYAVCDGGTAGSGNTCPSQRRPKFKVKLTNGLYVSCANTA